MELRQVPHKLGQSQSNSTKDCEPMDSLYCEPMKALTEKWCQTLEKRYDLSPKYQARNSCFLVTQILQRVKPGEVALLFSEPRSGATLFLKKVLEGCYRYALPVLFSSPKNDWMQLITRLASLDTGIPLTRLQRGTLLEKDFSKIVCFLGRLRDEDVYFSNEQGLNSLKLQKEMRLWKNKEGKRGLFLFDDYAEMEGYDSCRLKAVRNNLKKLAVDCNVPIIANVKIESMDDFFSRIKPCRNQEQFNQLRKSGLNIFLMNSPPSVDAFFLTDGACEEKVLRISMRHDKEMLDLLL